MNWDTQRAKEMVDNDSTIVTSMRALQAYATVLSESKSLCVIHPRPDW